MKQECKVVFEPSGRTVYVLKGTKLFEAAARAGLLLQSPCGGKGTCGKCRVRVTKGTCKPTAACRKTLKPEQLTKGHRLACQAAVTADCVVDIPATSLYDSRSKILTKGRGEKIDGKPAVWKKFVELKPPTSEDPAADLKRLERETGRLHVHLDVLHELPTVLRAGAFSGTAVVCCGRLLAFEAGNTEKDCYGVAFDLGTTTIVAVLIDLARRREVAVVAEMNPQIGSGDDVISRINRTREEPGALAEMQGAVVEAMNGMIARLCAERKVAKEHVYEVTVAGNTTMQHLFCGITPAALGELPFPPAYNRALLLDSREVALDIHPNGRLFVFPNIGGFVGGDTVAGILANGLDEAKKPSMLVDIGTNGEIVLSCNGKLSATSTAAGPAFEGARITAGMRATDGAIEKIVMNGDDIVCNVIGNVKPAGICGTALIDAAAELLRLGVLDTTGRILAPDELEKKVPSAIRKRLHPRDGHVNFLLVDADESKTGEAIYLYQRDVRELQLATGSIRAGVNIMLKKAGLEPDDLDVVLLAGGFGNFIRRSNARRIGLLPPIPCDRIRFVGNASSMGAKHILLSEEERAVAEAIAEHAEHIDLSLDPEFQMEFGMAMLFPENEPTGEHCD